MVCFLEVLYTAFLSSLTGLSAQYLHSLLQVSPKARDYMISSHVSAEPACKAVLESLQLSPIIHADMRLGEGTGAVAALPLIDMALAVYHYLMTYKDIGI